MQIIQDLAGSTDVVNICMWSPYEGGQLDRFHCSTNIPPIMIIKRIYENQNLLSLFLVSFLVGLRTYQHHCIYK